MSPGRLVHDLHSLASSTVPRSPLAQNDTHRGGGLKATLFDANPYIGQDFFQQVLALWGRDVISPCFSHFVALAFLSFV